MRAGVALKPLCAHANRRRCIFLLTHVTRIFQKSVFTEIVIKRAAFAALLADIVARGAFRRPVRGHDGQHGLNRCGGMTIAADAFFC